MELLLALLWGIRGRSLYPVALVNLLTNPPVVMLHLLFSMHGYGYFLHTLLPELAAIGVEAWILSRWDTEIRRPVLFALCANIFSYSMGVLLQSL